VNTKFLPSDLRRAAKRAQRKYTSNRTLGRLRHKRVRVSSHLAGIALESLRRHNPGSTTINSPSLGAWQDDAIRLSYALTPDTAKYYQSRWMTDAGNRTASPRKA
jgi:hypothetical protein